MNADVAGVCVIDEFVSAAAAATLVEAMRRGEDLAAATVQKHCEECSEGCDLLGLTPANGTCSPGYTSQPPICASLYFSARACANFFSILPGSPKLTSMKSRASAARYLTCADEDAYCLCHGLVRYGVPGQSQEHFSVPRLVSGGIMCINQIFGDPSPGQVKGCECLASPSYNATGGPAGNGHIKFQRSKSQYLDAGPNSFYIASNGGFSMVAVVRFTGSPGYYERLLDFGNGRPLDNIMIARYQTSSGLHITFWNGASAVCSMKLHNVLEQNTWLTVVVRFDAKDNFLEARVEGRGAANVTCAAAPQDRNISLGTYVGRSHWYGSSADEFLDAEIAGYFVIDEHLNMHAIKALEAAIYRGEDLTRPNCSACTPGKYLAGMGPSASTSTTLVDSWVITGRPPFTVRWAVGPEGAAEVLFMLNFRPAENAIVMNSRDVGGNWGTEERIRYAKLSPKSTIKETCNHLKETYSHICCAQRVLRRAEDELDRASRPGRLPCH